MRKYIVITGAILLVISTGLWQKNVYDNSLELLERNIKDFKIEISELNSINEEQKESIQKLTEENLALAIQSEELQNDLLAMKFDMVKNNLPEYWNDLWESVLETEGKLPDEKIEEVKFLLQPTFTYGDWSQVNPLSCYFTSYYKNIEEINLAEFLRYFPNGETPEILQEIEELRREENWPFQDYSLENIPVPIHRYKREMVQDVFTMYAGISLKDLSGVGFNEVLYLESTDSYYNYTSDFGPGVFTCSSGYVENGIIKLYGESNSDSDVVLTINKFNDTYKITSYHRE
jgi:regulator of replication initiation timing